MLALTLLVLAAAPKVTLVERSTLGLTERQATEARGKLVGALSAAGLEAGTAAEQCEDRSCLVAKSLKRDHCVLGVTLAKSRKGITVDLEAVDGELLVLQHTFIATLDKLEKAPELTEFAQQLAKKLAVRDAPVVTPAPQEPRPVVELAPRETPAWVDQRPVPPSRAPVVLGAVAAGVGAVAIGLLVANVVVKGELDRALGEQPYVTSLTRTEAEAKAATANALLVGGVLGLTLGLGGGATALGLGLSTPSMTPE